MSVDDKIKAVEFRRAVIEEQGTKRGLNMEGFNDACEHTKRKFEAYRDKEGKPSSFPTTYIRFDIPGAWAMETTVTLNFACDEGQLGVALITEIGWSSTGRDIAHATLAVSVYNKAIEFAALCEAVFNR
jgi:hypothetical protein